MTFETTRILLIDSYDSFTYNLAALCRRSIPGCSIHILNSDALTIDELIPYLAYYSAIIVGPGPGSPSNDADIGVVKDIWKISEEFLLPIFGVCLGLQSLGLEFGASLRRLEVVKHGQVSDIKHQGVDLFEGAGAVRAVRYHSLHIELAEDQEIEELGWTNDENGHVVMAIRHRKRPFWAVQYHPESVCTNEGGAEVLVNFWRLAQNWTKKTGRRTLPWNADLQIAGDLWPHVYHLPSHIPETKMELSVVTSVVDIPGISVVDICELFGASKDKSQFILLDSAAKPGRFSIIACLLSTSLQITHFVNDPYVRLTTDGKTTYEELGPENIWCWLASFMRGKKAQGGRNESPFWGGLVGILTYELGVKSLNIPLPRDLTNNTGRHPDVNLMFVERSIVVDTLTGQVYVQSLIPCDSEWIAETRSRITNISNCKELAVKAPEIPHPQTCEIAIPDKARYTTRILQAKEHLFAGDSYELCLTDQTRISLPKSPFKTSSSWERYKQLRKNNPAPHSGYLRLHPTTLLSSSPERFLSYSRPPEPVCQLRPIKGTVRKSPEITRAVAEKLLAGSIKEVAENLMIVDLIRHDLHGVLGDCVFVKQFCSVEEYETVWQLVSVIEGALTPERGGSNSDVQLGWEVLRRSLPPGSMTGAPKKRSVEILQSLEDTERSVYSGVFGYWCVGGSGDWSVTIRSCFKYDDCGNEADVVQDNESESWYIGAGGAITALSDPDAEWDEMLVKLQSVLRSFGLGDVGISSMG